MLDATRRVLAENAPHAGIELLFTPKEEVGLIGAAAFDESRLTARHGFVYDQAAPIGDIILGAPFSQSMEVTFHGPASHAGMHPEDGRNAIAAAARAIADLRLGRVDEQLDRERRRDPRRRRGEHRPRAVHLRRGGALTRRAAGSPTSCRRCSNRSRSPPRRAIAGGRRARKSYRGYRFKRDDEVVRARDGRRSARARRSRFVLQRRRGRREHLQRARAAMPQPRERDDGHPHPDERIAVADLEAMVDVTLALFDAALA